MLGVRSEAVGARHQPGKRYERRYYTCNQRDRFTARDTTRCMRGSEAYELGDGFAFAAQEVEDAGNFLGLHFTGEQAVHEVIGFGLTQMDEIPDRGDAAYCANSLF